MANRKNIISIETSSDICGVSLIKSGICIKTIEENSERKHVEKIPIFYKKLQDEVGFKDSEISAIAVSIGPGSFTGLRIGLSFAKGLALAQSLPIVPIPTMISLAFSQKNIREVCQKIPVLSFESIISSQYCPKKLVLYYFKRKQKKNIS